MVSPRSLPRILVATLALSIASLVAGCGSPPTFHSATKLAKALDCRHFVAAPPSSARYADMGSCDIDGTAVTVVTFTNDELRDNYRRLFAESTAYIAGTSYWIALSPDLTDSVGKKIQAPVHGLGCC